MELPYETSALIKSINGPRCQPQQNTFLKFLKIFMESNTQLD